MEIIRGEYWIVNGSIEFADGDIGDQNHESIARHHIQMKYSDEIINLADEMDISIERREPDICDILDQIHEKYSEEKQVGRFQADSYIIKELGIDRKIYSMLCGGSPGTYLMEYEEWIAVRGMNIELWAYNERKRKSLANGISEILEQEGIEETEELEFAIHDFTKEGVKYVTLADIENVQPRMTKPQLASVGGVGLQKFGNFQRPDTTENLPTSKPTSKPKTFTTAAQRAKIIPPGHELWRGTSESFKNWLEKNG